MAARTKGTRGRRPGSVKVAAGKIVSVQLSPEAKQALDNMCDKRGMTIKSALGRLIHWVTEQDPNDQAVVLGQIEGKVSTSGR